MMATLKAIRENPVYSFSISQYFHLLWILYSIVRSLTNPGRCQTMIKKVLFATLVASLVLQPVSAQQRYYYKSDMAGVPGSYMESSHSPTANNANPHGLPLVIHGPAVGQPGDAVSRNVVNQKAGAQVGLPPVKNSLYMGTPGDGIRTDLHRQINGQPMVSRRAVNSTIQNAGRQQAQTFYQPVIYGYGDYTKTH